MTQIELIKQEIERLENRCVIAETFAEELLSFIESLEQEQIDTDEETQWRGYKVGYNQALYDVKRKVDKMYDDASIGLNEYDSGLYNGIAETCSKLRGFIKTRLDESIEDSPKIKGWVARDMPLIGRNTGKLHFFITKPKQKEGYWAGEFHSVYGLDMFFRDISFADGPIEVELTIRKV